MSNSLSRAYEDYEAYELLSAKFNEKPLDMQDPNQSKHEKNILNTHNWERTYFGYQPIPVKS